MEAFAVKSPAQLCFTQCSIEVRLAAFNSLLLLSSDWVKDKPFIRERREDRGSELHRVPHCRIPPDVGNAGGGLES